MNSTLRLEATAYEYGYSWFYTGYFAYPFSEYHDEYQAIFHM